jgi:hypothetical protein
MISGSRFGQISRASLFRERICRADECAVVTQESRADSNQLRYSFRLVRPRAGGVLGLRVRWQSEK